MERPSCGMCPYWDNSDDTIEREPNGWCKRRSPSLPSTSELVNELTSKNHPGI